MQMKNFLTENFLIYLISVILKKKSKKGIGFDKPELDPDDPNTCGCVSDKSFGHYGFTGSVAWVDPETEIIYVFIK